MSELTPNLKLFKYNTETDAKQPFSINDCMNANWDKIDASLGSLEICDIGMALYVDETKGLRRYLNGQIVDINTNTQAFLDRLLQIQTTNPDYFTNEETWQSEATLNVDGCVYKFVLNYDSTGTNVASVRLPKYPDYVEVSAGSSITTAPVTGFVRGSQNSGIVNLPALAQSSSWDGKYSLNSNGKYNGFTLFAQDGSGNVSVRDGFTGSQWKVDAQADLSNLKLKNTKLKLYYFIQIATGSETENNIINEIELNNPYSLFDSKYSDHELNNLSWLKSEGQWNAKAVYPTAYDKLLKVYNGTETVEGLSVKLSTETYTDYDFVLNTTEETFRLPLLNGSEDLPSDKYDDLKLLASGSTYTAPANGWVSVKGTSTSTTSYIHLLILMDNNNEYYGDNPVNTVTNGGIATVLPIKKGDRYQVRYERLKNLVFKFIYAQGNGSLYYYVGETVQNANLIDAGRIGEQLATKIDMLQASGAGMPSNRYIDLTLGATGSTYTAPANGWFQCACTGTVGSTFFELVHNCISCCASFTGGWGRASMPVTKGMVITIYYGGNNFTKQLFRFTYAEGSK